MRCDDYQHSPTAFTGTNGLSVGGVSAAVSKTAAAPIERVKLLIQNQVCFTATVPRLRKF